MIPGRDLRTKISTADEDSNAWTRKQRCLQLCKENAWKRWKLNTQQHFDKGNLSHKDKTRKINIGYIVMSKVELKNRGHSKIGKVSRLYAGKDAVVRAFQVGLTSSAIVSVRISL